MLLFFNNRFFRKQSIIQIIIFNSEANKSKGTEILNNPDIIKNAPITIGCVVQKADNFLGVLGKVTHSMYVTDYSNNSIALTYHSRNTLNKSLLDFCRQEPDAYYLFYIY